MSSKPNVKAPVSVVVFTFNEETNVEAALRSVDGWCEEIVVVDSGSSDRTIDICRKYTDSIFVHPYTDHSSQWAWALEEIPFKCEWLLRLDADQVATDELKSQISKVLESPEEGVHGYYAVHRHFFQGQRIHGFPHLWLVLVHRPRTRIDESEMVDFRFVIQGNTRLLTGEIHESNRKEDDIDFWIDKHQKFSSRMAAEEALRRKGMLTWTFRPTPFGTPDQRMAWVKNIWYGLPLFVRPFLFFVYRFVFRLGFLDGTTGFTYHVLHAFWFRFLVDVKIRRILQKVARGELQLDALLDNLRDSP